MCFITSTINLHHKLQPTPEQVPLFFYFADGKAAVSKMNSYLEIDGAESAAWAVQRQRPVFKHGVSLHLAQTSPCMHSSILRTHMFIIDTSPSAVWDTTLGEGSILGCWTSRAKSWGKPWALLSFAERTPSHVTPKVLCAAEPFLYVVLVSRAVSKDVPLASLKCSAAVVLVQTGQLQRWPANLVRFGNQQRVNNYMLKSQNVLLILPLNGFLAWVLCSLDCKMGVFTVPISELLWEF